MKEHHRAALDMVYPIVDCLQSESIFLNVKREQGIEQMRIKGSQKIAIPVAEGVELKGMMEIRASNVQPKESYALIHVMGDLWVLLSFLRDDKELYFWIIDAAKIPDGNRPKTGGYFTGQSVSYCADKLAPGCIAIFKRKREDAEWIKMSDAEGISGPLSPGEAAAASASTATVEEDDEEDADPVCPLCAEIVADGEETVTTSSGYTFHADCHDEVGLCDQCATPVSCSQLGCMYKTKVGS